MITLKDFILYEYDEKNYDHLVVIRSLCNDLLVQKFMGDIDSVIANINNKNQENHIDQLYIVKNNQNYIGIIYVNLLDNNNYYLSYALLHEYRGNHYSEKLLKEYTNYLFDHTPIETIYLSINPGNIASRKIAYHVGFNKNGTTKYSMSR